MFVCLSIGDMSSQQVQCLSVCVSVYWVGDMSSQQLQCLSVCLLMTRVASRCSVCLSVCLSIEAISSQQVQ